MRASRVKFTPDETSPGVSGVAGGQHVGPFLVGGAIELVCHDSFLFGIMGLRRSLEPVLQHRIARFPVVERLPRPVVELLGNRAVADLRRTLANHDQGGAWNHGRCAPVVMTTMRVIANPQGIPFPSQEFPDSGP